MAEEEQQKQELPESPVPKKRGVFRSVLLTLLILVILLVSAFAIMFSTDKGSKFLLNRVLERQQIIHYEYESGNLLKGIILKNVLVTLSAVDVKIDRAEVSLGRPFDHLGLRFGHGYTALWQRRVCAVCDPPQF